jgi:alpha-L-fucosidase
MRKILFLLALIPLFVTAQNAPKPVAPLPSANQIAWQKMETYAFVHFGLNTFGDREWGYGDAPLSSFNPSRLDCEQWARTVKAAGMKGIILTAKHHDGFCLWPTRYTDYSIRNTPYKNCKGDIVGELADACKKYGLKFGLYLSPWDRHQAFYGTDLYREYFYAQLKELLTNYGELFEIWFDGANGGDGWYGGTKEIRKIDRRTYYDFPRAWKMVAELQPKTVIFSDGGPGCRWVGNEEGYAFATNWSFLRSREVYPGYDKYWTLQHGHADGDAWIPAECDVSIRPGWFYHESEDNKVKSVDQLVDLYYRSVGHNSTLLINFPIDKDGLIHPIDSARIVAFHKRIESELGNNLLKTARIKADNVRGRLYSEKALTDNDYDSYWTTDDDTKNAVLDIRLKKPEKINRLMLQEYISLGQRVKTFAVEYLSDREWLPVNAGEETTTIGYKRILRIKTIKTKRLRITFTDCRGPVCINNIGAYYAPNAHDAINDNAKPLKGLDYKIISHDDAQLTIDLGMQHSIKSFFYLPNQTDHSGIVSDYELYAGNDIDNMKLIKQGQFQNIRNHPIMQEVYFTPTDARYIKFKAVRMVNEVEAMKYQHIAVQ